MSGSEKSSPTTENKQLALPDVETREWRKTANKRWETRHKLLPSGRLALIARKRP